MSVTSLEQIKNAAIQQIEIAGFEKNTSITVKVRKPSMMRLAKEGKIPNQLLSQATELFEAQSESKAKSGDEEFDLGELGGLVYLYVEAALVEPSYEDVKEYLTDEQLMDIFSWAQGGVEALSTFHSEAQDTGLDSDE